MTKARYYEILAGLVKANSDDCEGINLFEQFAGSANANAFKASLDEGEYAEFLSTRAAVCSPDFMGWEVAQ